ncbi:MFS transporter [Effusibacillus dendaii]|uniref:Multidrug resistance protein n=1 Tax=Effusibacillus dendaii TaxID=2743772 RepID=A0A7I8DDP0_9BACL|nr:MFS transporter [Effusibacillus dendaii]BCJ86640.1 multidrug resistance protein [Effusibacillus dendaii]
MGQSSIDEKQASRAILTTCLAALFGFMGIGVVDPILPVIAEQIGATPWQVEMLFTSYIFMMAIIMIPSGILSAKFGSKRFMVLGLGLVTLFALACALSSSITQLAVLRAGWGMGNAMFFATSMSILIGMSTNLEKSMGYYEAALGVGMSVGPLLGGLLGYFGWRMPFFATSVFMLIAFLMTIAYVKEPKETAKRDYGMKDFIAALSYRPFLNVALTAMFYYYSFFTVLAYSPIFLKLGAIQLGLIFFAWGICLGFGSTKLAHGMINRYGAASVSRIGLVLMAVALLLILVIPSNVFRIAVIIASGLASGINNTTFSTLAIEVSNAQRSIASGAYNFVRWLGAAIAPVLAGFVERLFGTAPYAISLVLVLIGVILCSIGIARSSHSSHA